MSYPSRLALATSAILVVASLSSEEVRAEQASCAANKAVYARPDGSEFIVRYVGMVRPGPPNARYYDPPGTRYLEGEMTRPDHDNKAFWTTERVVFTTTEQSSPSGAKGRFNNLGVHYSSHQARYEIEWIEKPADEPDPAVISSQGPAWAGTWKLVRCDGKSARAAAAIEAARRLNCPLNRVVFVDENTGQRFKAEKYAEDFVYIHEGGESKTPPKDRDGNLLWARRVGYWIIQGSLEGSEAYLKLESTSGTPAQISYSYYPGSRNLRQLKLRWLSGGQVPVVRDENIEEFSLSAVGTVNNFITGTGPLNGMTLRPVECDLTARR